MLYTVVYENGELKGLNVMILNEKDRITPPKPELLLCMGKPLVEEQSKRRILGDRFAGQSGLVFIF